MDNKLNVKVGDKVLHHSRWHGDRITKVVKITAGGNIRTADGGYFNPDGRAKSSDIWADDYIEESTAEHEERLKKKSIRRYVLNTDYSKLSEEKIMAIYEILKGECKHDS